MTQEVIWLLRGIIVAITFVTSVVINLMFGDEDILLLFFFYFIIVILVITFWEGIGLL